MKLEDLLNYSADEAEKLTDAQLIELCKPFWNVTRPDPSKYKGKQNEVLKQASTAKKVNINNQAVLKGLSLMEQYKHLIK